MEKYNDRTPMPFGKYKGTTLANVPAVYLLFIYDAGYTMPQGLKQYIIDNMTYLQREAQYARR
jgi:uncharacterized protein (DUF3820 family)